LDIQFLVFKNWGLFVTAAK